ncbi:MULTISPECIES: Y-family DNA polymerase [unclassified Psychrobacter]|uniref:Y-family DNA polymerase n=1 Tax=unclassified Psychrobacter TaxID=196806 RepID=UPI003FD1A245
MYALVDCNSFYANCEKLFRPDLKDKPVVVLSNNDGCVVARSPEAKRLGIKMGVPYFQVKEFCNEHKVTVFSSNYALYADMSQRVMTTIETLCPTVEVYSIDEAFLYLADYPVAMQDLKAYASKLKMIIESHTGIAVSVGIGSTKTMAKLANHAAKKYPATNGICVLESLRWIRRLMQITDVGELWGVGRRYKLRLNAMGIHTVHQLAVCEPGKIRQHFGVVLERTCLELNGQSCLGIESIEPKKQIISSRSFSRRVTCLDELSESICSHVAKAASKLRKQDSVCHYLSVFSMNSPFNQSETYTAISGQYQFVTPTADTRVMILAARQVLQIIYKENVRYAKAGVMLLDLCPHDEVQLDLFANKSDSKDDQISDKSEVITTLMDELNKKYGQNSQQQAALFIASEGIKDKQTWQMSREMLSPCYTTNINQIPKVH